MSDTLFGYPIKEADLPNEFSDRLIWFSRNSQHHRLSDEEKDRMEEYIMIREGFRKGSHGEWIFPKEKP